MHVDVAQLQLHTRRADGVRPRIATVADEASEARGVAVATCPPAFVDAAEEAMKELGKQDAPRADRGDVVIRTQPVQVTFRLGDL